MFASVRRALLQARFNSTLVIAEHNDETLSPVTMNALSAAQKIGNDISVLVAGANSRAVAKSAAKLPNVKRVLVAEDAQLKNQLPERVTAAVLAAHEQFKFSHIVAGGTSWGRNVIPRAAAKLDVSPISDITAVHDAETFSRPMYAGNAIAKVCFRCFSISTLFSSLIAGQVVSDSEDAHRSRHSI